MQEIFYYLSKFEFVFYLLICIFILISFLFIIKQKVIKLILLSLFGIIFPVFLFETYFAITMPNILSRDKYDFEINNLETQEIQIRSSTENKSYYKFYKSTVYSNGFRYTKSNFNSQDGFVFLGCSFTHGDGLNDDEALPYYFSQLYNFDKFVLNCSVGGRGTNFAFNVMNSDIVHDFNKQVKVKYFIYSVIGDHINRNFNVSTFNLADDSFILENNKLVRVKESLGFLKIIFKKSYIFHMYFINFINDKNKNFHEEYFVEKIIQMKNIAKEKYDAELIVVLWPDVEEQVIEKLKDKNINIILLDKKFEKKEYKVKNDGHPNGKANEEIAQILFDYINNKS